ncbi:beta-lactamase-like protein [Thelonectria olida]|uniref:Beta-lactamase-like protein n=1 Tax=Thelonectria olida TaxID=1576542 RepID=A0A9P9AI85_9HYPO|nr:beta-lactamase-like protein [Thelonectria olida]
MSTITPTTCFSASRLNDTTFVIVEDDKWNENPYIYVKLFPTSLVLVDTGCGGAAKDPSVELSSLRTFIETFPVADNAGEPLNEKGTRNYVVICTHCHFDHIGGIEQFTDAESTVWASAYDKDFIEGPGRLPQSSLCRFAGMETPEYQVTNWAGDGQHLVDSRGDDLGLTLYQTPGHTPDQLAIWDPRERFLFVGDTIYEWSAILFPPEGSVTAYSGSIGRLKKLVQEWNQGSGPTEDQLFASRVKMACGHNTRDVDALEMLMEVDQVLLDAVELRIQPVDGGVKRGEQLELYEGEGGRVSFLGSRAGFTALRNNIEAVEEIRRRC